MNTDRKAFPVAIKIGGLELATTGDVIVGGLTYGTAFAIDAFFFTGGAASAEVAGAAAAATWVRNTRSRSRGVGGYGSLVRNHFTKANDPGAEGS